MTSIRRVAVVIVTYNTRALLAEALEAVRREAASVMGRRSDRRVEVFVVDNASSDGTGAWLAGLQREGFSLPLHLQLNEENLGPARAYNQGVRRALASGVEALLLLNSDTILTEGCLRTLWEHLEANPHVAGVGGPLVNPDGTPQRTRKSIHRILPYWRTDRPHAVTFLGTGFKFVRAGAYEAVGLYDEFYYFYNEDLDWMTRAKRAGLVFHFHPDARAIHYGGGGRKQNVAPIVRDLYRANAYYFAKFYSPPVVRLALALLRLELRLRIARTARLLRRSRREEGQASGATNLALSLEVLEAARANLEAFVAGGGLARAREAHRRESGDSSWHA